MTVGTPPGTGPQLVDGAWLLGISGGENQTFGIVAAPNAASQSTGTPIPSGVSLIEIDSGVNTGSVVLPAAVAGTEISIINNLGSGNAVNVYANPATNQLTGTLDKIGNASNATATPISGATAGTIMWFACAKNGAWYSK